MKKILGLLLALMMLVSLMPVVAVAEVDTSNIYANVAPLEKPMDLNIGYLSGSHRHDHLYDSAAWRFRKGWSECKR